MPTWLLMTLALTLSGLVSTLLLLAAFAAGARIADALYTAFKEGRL
jgi:hypothetical protein